MKGPLKIMVKGVLREDADGEIVGIGLAYMVGEKDAALPREATVLTLAEAIVMRDMLSEVIETAKGEMPEISSRELAEGITEGCSCSDCESLLSHIADIVKATGRCPTHGIAFADGVGCPLCDRELAAEN